MIDWYNLVMNAFWVLGCAVALATLSYASWDASVSKEKFFVLLKQSQYQIPLNFGGLVFCVGLAGTSDVVWQQVLWGVLALGFIYQIVMEIRESRKQSLR
jgi:hypothetical protein